MKPLEWLARNVEAWDDDHTEIVFDGWFVGGKDPVAYIRLINEGDVRGIHTKQEWQQERERLGLDKVAANLTEAWDGTGLPPVGVECENRSSNSGFWYKCEIVAHWKGLAVFVDDTAQAGTGHAKEFRPIKTERDRVIENAVENLSQDDLRSLDWSREHAKRVAGQLYDAGLLTKPQ